MLKASSSPSSYSAGVAPVEMGRTFSRSQPDPALRSHRDGEAKRSVTASGGPPVCIGYVTTRPRQPRKTAEEVLEGDLEIRTRNKSRNWRAESPITSPPRNPDLYRNRTPGSGGAPSTYRTCTTKGMETPPTRSTRSSSNIQEAWTEPRSWRKRADSGKLVTLSCSRPSGLAAIRLRAQEYWQRSTSRRP